MTETSAYAEVLPVRERKGTMYLRADHGEYDLTKVRVSNWSQDAESYPKDYDVKKDRPWNLKRSTYNHLSNLEGPFPRTTTQSLYDDLLLKYIHVDKDASKPIQSGISGDKRLDGNLVREVVGRKLIDTQKFYGLTTYKDDYDKYNGKSWAPKQKTAEELTLEAALEREQDNLTTLANKDNLSQFTEKYFNKRIGRNTWQDETGVYATALQKRLNTTQFNPILNCEER